MTQLGLAKPVPTTPAAGGWPAALAALVLSASGAAAAPGDPPAGAPSRTCGRAGPAMARHRQSSNPRRGTCPFMRVSPDEKGRPAGCRTPPAEPPQDGGNAWESNPPRTSETPDTGFEGPGIHQDPFAPPALPSRAVICQHRHPPGTGQPIRLLPAASHGRRPVPAPLPFQDPAPSPGSLALTRPGRPPQPPRGPPGAARSPEPRCEREKEQ